MANDVLSWINNAVKKLTSVESDDSKKIERKLNRNKEVNVDLVNSKRFYGPGSNGHYIDDDAVVGSMDEYAGNTEAEIPSTAVDKVKYDPKSRKLWVKFVKGTTYYLFERVSPQVFQSFMNASSKGRFVNNVLKPNHQAKKGDY